MKCSYINNKKGFASIGELDRGREKGGRKGYHTKANSEGQLVLKSIWFQDNFNLSLLILSLQRFRERIF